MAKAMQHSLMLGKFEILFVSVLCYERLMLSLSIWNKLGWFHVILNTESLMSPRLNVEVLSSSDSGINII